MNTVDALNVLGKALLGDAYTPGVGRTDAETIDDIAKAVSENPIGGGGSPMVVSVDIDTNPTNPDQYTATITTPWEEIANAFNSGQTVLVQVGLNTTTVTSVSFENEVYYVTVAIWPYRMHNGAADFATDTPDGEPTHAET